MNVIGSYNYALVALSVFIAMCAATMGIGIWSMHYTGMAASFTPASTMTLSGARR